MNRYVITFGLSRPGISKGWVEVSARSEEITRWWARETYGVCWSGVYDADEFLGSNSPNYYPLGRLDEWVLHYEEVPA